VGYKNYVTFVSLMAISLVWVCAILSNLYVIFISHTVVASCFRQIYVVFLAIFIL
jgi:hypothetical protein